MTTARAGAVNAFARGVAEHDIELDRSRSLDDFVASVVAVAGLGPWTAQYLAPGLGEPDAFPAADLGLRRALAGLTGQTVSVSEAEALSREWRPNRAHAAAPVDGGLTVPARAGSTHGGLTRAA